MKQTAINALDARVEFVYIKYIYETQPSVRKGSSFVREYGDFGIRGRGEKMTNDVLVVWDFGNCLRGKCPVRRCARLFFIS